MPLTAAAMRPRDVVETFVLLISPFAPHIAEELWGKLGHEETLTYASWPGFDPALAQDESQEYVVQVNGKVRHRFRAAAGIGAVVLAAARSEPEVMALLEGRAVIKEIVIPGRLVNFVLREVTIPYQASDVTSRTEHLRKRKARSDPSLSVCPVTAMNSRDQEDV